MAVTYTLTDGSTSISLVGSDFKGRDRGRIALPLQPNAQVVETVRVRLLPQTSQDAAAADFQSLVKLLMKVRQFRDGIWQRRPVYIEHKAHSETNSRYAFVYEVREIDIPDLLGYQFQNTKSVGDMSFEIVRDAAWRSNPPGTLGNAVTQGATSGSEASPTLTFVSNHRDDEDVDSIYVDDGGVFSGSYHATAAWTMFPATTVANDALYVGSAGPWCHVVFDVGTIGNYSATLVLEYWNGSAWSALTFGVDYTVYAHAGGEVASASVLFKQLGKWSINLFPKSNWATTSVNSLTKYWIRIRASAVTTWTASPANATNQPYSQRAPFIELPAASIKGDTPGHWCLRLRTPSGGSSSPGPATLSRIILGAKSLGLTTFTSHLNCGNADNPAAWTTVYGTDTAAAVDVQAPGGSRGHVTFATDSSMKARITLTGDDILSDFSGEYLVFIRVQQIGGSAGDCSVKLRTFIGGSNADDPQADLGPGKTSAADKGPEVLPLGLIRLPFSEVLNSDSLASTDVIFQIHAQRSTGSSVLRLYDIILIPTDEWSSGVDDFAVDTASGSGSLKGGTVLDLDSGVLGTRALKYRFDGTNLVPSDVWAVLGRPPLLENLATKTRIYFIMLHYAVGGTWGSEPLIANLGCELATEVYAQYRYLVLRGSD